MTYDIIRVFSTLPKISNVTFVFVLLLICMAFFSLASAFNEKYQMLTFFIPNTPLQTCVVLSFSLIILLIIDCCILIERQMHIYLSKYFYRRLYSSFISYYYVSVFTLIFVFWIPTMISAKRFIMVLVVEKQDPRKERIYPRVTNLQW